MASLRCGTGILACVVFASLETQTTQAGMPVLLNLCFFARRDDYLMPQSGVDSPDGRWSGPG